MPVPDTALLITLLAHIGGPMMSLTHTHPPHSMDIAIADDNATVVAGQPLRYLITVHNATGAHTPVTVRVTLSPITDLHADHGAVVANAAAWRNTLDPGSTATYSIAAVAAPGEHTDLAATACVHLAAGAPALTCATDINTIADATPRKRGPMWLASIALGLLAVAGAVLLDRKVRPELLTSDNALRADNTPGQPGGAPPV